MSVSNISLSYIYLELDPFRLIRVNIFGGVNDYTVRAPHNFKTGTCIKQQIQSNSPDRISEIGDFWLNGLPPSQCRESK